MGSTPRDYGEQCRFDAYCKVVLRNEAKNYLREQARQRNREKSLDALTQAELDKLCVIDRYPSDSIAFSSHGCDLHIDNELVAEALNALPQDNRDIFLMYLFLGMADREIAEHLHMVRRTVNARRQSAYRLLKELMGGEADD